MFELSSAFWVFLLLALGFAVGFWLAQRLRRRTERPRKMPRHWPLAPRPVLNARELPAWQWLRQIFGHEHPILIKMPVTRFTAPRSAQEGQQWHELLNAVYCTFTVCNADGHVLGCVDVPPERGASRTNLGIKQSLLAQCSVPYWVVDPQALPAPHAIRADFLGDLNQVPPPQDASAELPADPLNEARTQLHELLDRRRSAREGLNSDNTPLAADTGPWLHPSEMQRTDSFLIPLEDDDEADPITKRAPPAAQVSHPPLRSRVA